MAIPWMLLLKTVPWSEVIANAPSIAEGARKLWKKVGTSGTATSAPRPTPIVVEPGGDLIAALRHRVEQLSSRTELLEQELQASSALIKALADQNAELVQRVEAHRLRLRWLSALTLLVLLGMGWLTWRVL